MRPKLAKELVPIAQEMRRLSLKETHHRGGEMLDNDYSWQPDSLVKFLPESSGQFVLPPSPYPCSAVTGDAIDSQVIFNLDKVSDPQEFTYEQSIRLWIHEIGHKYIAQKNLTGVEKEKTQAAIDELAATVGRYFGVQIVTGPFFAINVAPRSTSGHGFAAPIERYLSRKPNQFAFMDSGKVWDLSVQFNQKLDEAFKRRGSIDLDRQVREIVILGQRGPKEFWGTVRLNVYRRPRNLDHYSVLDLGGPIPHVAEFTIEPDSEGPPTLHIHEYKEDIPDIERADDAEFELPEFKLQPDGAFKARLNLTVRTERYWHAVAFPVNQSAKLIVVANGKTAYVPLTTRAVFYPEKDLYVDKAWSAFPGEIRGQPMFKRATIEGKLPEGWPHEFNVIGLIDDFFLLRFNEGTAKPRLVAIKSPLHVSGCEGSLKK